MNKFFPKFFALVLWGFMFSGSAFAQHARSSPELLSDIQIMETVLDKLIDPNTRSVIIFGSNSKGFYLEDYGVIFNVNQPFTDGEILNLKLNKLLKRGTAEAAIFNEKKVNQINLKEKLDKLKKTLIHFMGAYASSMRDLPQNERVTIVVDFNGFGRYISDDNDYLPRQLIATVTVADLKNYRLGKISEHALTQKISFAEIKTVDEDMAILGNVIKTSLQHGKGKDSFYLAGDVKGIYFDDYGVLFLINIELGINLLHIKEGLQSFTIASSNRKSAADIKEKLRKLENKIIRSIANYGHTLRNLQPNDWVEVAINFNNRWGEDEYSKCIVKVEKKVIDDYYRDRIDMDQFKKLVQISYY